MFEVCLSLGRCAQMFSAVSALCCVVVRSARRAGGDGAGGAGVAGDQTSHPPDDQVLPDKPRQRRGRGPESRTGTVTCTVHSLDDVFCEQRCVASFVLLASSHSPQIPGMILGCPTVPLFWALGAETFVKQPRRPCWVRVLNFLFRPRNISRTMAPIGITLTLSVPVWCDNLCVWGGSCEEQINRCSLQIMHTNAAALEHWLML